MTGIRFQSWEYFLCYVQKREKTAQEKEWSNTSKLFDVDYLEADEWEGLQKMLSVTDYEELTAEKRVAEVRSFHVPEETGRMIFYSVGEEDTEGGYLCMGYGFVNGMDVEDKANRFVPMPERQEREKEFYYIGTENDYWEYYPILQMYLPEKVLEYLACQVDILDGNYGADRDVEGGMGGFCAVIPKMDEAAKKAYSQILERHYIQESMYEYLDTVTVDGKYWAEVLYLTNNDYGIVLIYQKGVEA